MDTARIMQLLLDLQDIVSNWEHTRAQIQAKRARIAELERHQAARTQKLEQCARELEATKRTRTQLEQRLAELEAQRAHARRRMQEVRTPKELDAMTHQLEAIEQQISQVEEQALQSMEQEETLQRELQERQRQHASRSEAETEEIERLRKLLATDEELRCGLESDRDRVAAAFPDPEVVAIFNWLHEKNGLPVVVPLEGDACGGCRAILPTSMIAEIRSGTGELHHCPQCRRLLYAPSKV